ALHQSGKVGRHRCHQRVGRSAAVPASDQAIDLYGRASVGWSWLWHGRGARREARRTRARGYRDGGRWLLHVRQSGSLSLCGARGEFAHAHGDCQQPGLACDTPIDTRRFPRRPCGQGKRHGAHRAQARSRLREGDRELRRPWREGGRAWRADPGSAARARGGTRRHTYHAQRAHPGAPLGETAVLERTQASDATRFNEYDRPHQDLREFISRAERAGEIVSIKGADWKLEMGTLAELVNHARPEPPAILFENVPGYPEEMRLFSGATNSSKRLAIALGLPVPKNPLDVVRAYRDRMQRHRPIPPKLVASGPVLENVDRDEQVDLWKFPVPLLHEGDGGRYIGTDDLVIMRDPEQSWVNCATYRVMVHDRNHVSIWISPGKHGRQIREKYFRAGKQCPLLISCGHDPLLFLAGGNELKF